VWEVRVALAPDPVSGRSRHPSITVYGDLGDGQGAREQLAAAARLSGPPPRPGRGSR
jgi:hypothetical protein